MGIAVWITPCMDVAAPLGAPLMFMAADIAEGTTSPAPKFTKLMVVNMVKSDIKLK